MENPQKKPIPQTFELLFSNLEKNIYPSCSFCSEKISDSELHFVSTSSDLEEGKTFLICKNYISTENYLNFSL